MKIFRNSTAAIILLGFLSACSNNYTSPKTITETGDYARVLARANKGKGYYVMYSGHDTFRITQVEVEKSKQQFTVHLAKVDSAYRANVNHPENMPGRLIHVYMSDSVSYTLDEPHTIAMNKVARIQRLH